MIVKMLHLDLVCLAAEKTATLEKLRDLGAVHLDLASAQGASVAEAKGAANDVALHLSAALDRLDGQIRAALDEVQMKVEG